MYSTVYMTFENKRVECDAFRSYIAESMESLNIPVGDIITALAIIWSKTPRDGAG